LTPADSAQAENGWNLYFFFENLALLSVERKDDQSCQAMACNFFAENAINYLQRLGYFGRLGRT